MVTTITLNDPDTVHELVVMLSALQRTGELSMYQESVVDNVLTSCYEQEPALDPDTVEDCANSLRQDI